MEESVSAQNQNTPQASSNTLLKILALVGVLFMVAGSAYAGYWYGISGKAVTQPKTSTSGSQQVDKEATPSSEIDTIGWKAFVSASEGFSLKYPSDWQLHDNVDQSNCDHSRVNDTVCAESFDFISPSGISVRYVDFGDEDKTDRWICGGRYPCTGDIVSAVESLDVPKFGQVYLVKLDLDSMDKMVAGSDSYLGNLNSIELYALHRPLSSETTPSVGKEPSRDLQTHYTLPARAGGRYSLFVTAENTAMLKNPTPIQLESINAAVLVLKSLTYDVTAEELSEATKKWETYHSKEYGYSVEYPKGGTVKEELTLNPVAKEGVKEHMIIFNLSSGFMRVDAWDNSHPYGDIGSWLKAYPNVVDTSNSVVSGATKYKVAGEDATVIYTPSSPQASAVWRTFFVRGNKIFSLLYAEGTPANFEMYRHFLSTFDFDNTKNISDILPQESDFR
ncbi:hypothetical protein COT51_00865 [candidate division WWE3 bacterium CG08_land_8_20_14_0_20_41_15]|uniref:Uncharacterized protein n=1 Tax=candidate division WWE3 bacterium CG08_land_8_20_14_0_20_41_15 TaxID=1975086 RepID=A0A2H0XA50_UNCKA|nr:MAG: hypothetical protein COT51_00865 [candidate division WWE3 bacterium CG08_land_8_20_14_0_20_41_15]